MKVNTTILVFKNSKLSYIEFTIVAFPLETRPSWELIYSRATSER